MRRRKSLVAGIVFLLLADCVVTLPEWNQPYFVEPNELTDEVTWLYDEDTPSILSVTIWEERKIDVELTRLSFKPDETNSLPTLTYLDEKGLGLQIHKDEDPKNSVYLKATEPGDYESGDESFVIFLNTQDPPIQVLVRVAVENINDNPPIIKAPSKCEFEETKVHDDEWKSTCEFTVTDADGGACFVIPTIDDEHFRLRQTSTPTRMCKEATFLLEVVKALDYETYRIHFITIDVEDHGIINDNPHEQINGGSQKQSLTFVVNVVDMPDEPPVWQTLHPYISVDEKTDGNEFQFLARDGDIGLNWTIKYSLKFTSEYEEFEEYFEIDDNGLFRVKCIDRDEIKREIFSVEVVATEVPDNTVGSDFIPEKVNTTVVIMVNDKNDHIPEITLDKNDYEINEETTFSSNFKVVDPDLGENGQYNLKLEDNTWSSNFQLIPSSGYQTAEIIISSLNQSLLDYEDEEWREITLTIVAEEVADKSHIGTAKLTIRLINLFDEPPEFHESSCGTVRFDENQEKGFKVKHAEATDRDEGDKITYTLSNNYMEIDKDSGLITSTSDNAFDYERQPEIVLQVVAKDLGNLTTFCEVIIELQDINDEPPSLIMPYNSLEVEEHSDKGTQASEKITATDPDAQAELAFEIDWTRSVAYKNGIAVSRTELYMSSVDLLDPPNLEGNEWSTYLFINDDKKFDWEVFDTLRLQINVIDKTTHPDYLDNKERSAIMTVLVGDKNDCPPVFTEDSKNAVFTVNENMPSGRTIGAILATDDDSPKHSQITYSIEPISPEGLVADASNPRLTIHKDTGRIYTTETEIDCDEWQTLEFKYKVIATDSVFFTDTNITINIQDLNDNSPEVTDPEEHELTFEEKEGTPGRWPVGCILGRDIDVTEEYHTITYYIEGSALKLFEMEETCKPLTECCLFVKDGSELNREDIPSHEIQVYSRDNFAEGIRVNSNEGPTVKMKLILIDVNDNPPVFEKHDTPFEVRETMDISESNIFKVGVTDEDIGDNAKFWCEENPEVTLTFPQRPDEDLDGVFKVKTEEDGCVVIATKNLRGLWGDYSLTLTAHDVGAPGENSNTGFGHYSLVVINENLNRPEMTYPTSRTSIVIGREQPAGSTGSLIQINGTEVPDFTATDGDDPRTLNGQVSFNLTGGESIFYMDPSPMINTAVLRMSRPPNFGDRKFIMSVFAKDKAEIGSMSSATVDFVIWVLNSQTYPEFVELEPEVVEFEENEGGLEKSEILRAAVNLDEEYLEEDDRQPVYYHIVEGDTNVFKLDKETRELSLLVMLDYETVPEYRLKIFASHSKNPDDGNMNDVNVLEVIVNVIDVNDMPPQFLQQLFAGTFSADHKPGQRIMQLEAYDPDTDDKTFFELIPETIKAHDTSLQQFVSETAFLIEKSTGLITLNFSPNNRDLSGYFEFRVQAYDLMGNVEGHRDEASVHVYVVSDSHRVEFNFMNPVSVVETKQNEMAGVFSEVLGYTCVVEEVMKVDNANGAETTDVITHFINETDKSPVPRRKIEDQFLDARTYSALFGEMSSLSLAFAGFSNLNPAVDKNNHATTIVLAAVCAVLSVLVFVFLLAFIVRTRTLNQRLEKLTKPKFGSQDSGLNRAGMAVPGTNVHALEGSNPVWNHETVIDQMFDNLSQSSGDSDLVGIEDNPYFNSNSDMGGISNPAFQPQFGVNPHAMPSAPPPPLDGPRRTSINPLAAAAAAETQGDGFDSRSNAGSLAMSLEDVDMPRRISLNPLISDLKLDLDAGQKDTGTASTNFSFQRPHGEPTTDL